jgi:hypothetical protein
MRRVIDASARSSPTQVMITVGLLAALAVAGAWALLAGDASRGAPIVVTLRGPVATTLDPSSLSALAGLEQRLAALPGVHAVVGPATLLEGAATGMKAQEAQYLAAAGPPGSGARRRAATTVGIRFGFDGPPALTNASFVGEVVFGTGSEPKRQLAPLFPDGGRALIVVRPQAGLSADRVTRLGRRIEQLVAGANLVGVEASVR